MTRRTRATAGSKPAADRPAARVLAGGKSASRVAVDAAMILALHRNMVAVLRKGRPTMDEVDALAGELVAVLGEADGITQGHADLMDEASAIMAAHDARTANPVPYDAVSLAASMLNHEILETQDVEACRYMSGCLDQIAHFMHRSGRWPSPTWPVKSWRVEQGVRRRIYPVWPSRRAKAQPQPRGRGRSSGAIDR